ncbi:NAD(P)H nitroreductase [Actinoplanes sichuanensis]|uniref:Nitroreductase family protein n=1 Tax=Actinoplanes sichuanensis TaxID=512349 RepID=A0ABW4AC16_9ACTN|nr:nitroreductase family protein [Actinoplanes sichuanensis]BEL06955.1 NAD(P)H nitroreductase [Actinoplanes sichuanensis]
MTRSFAPPSRRVLADCVRAAIAAPSLHNSQPWMFRITGPAVEVRADPARRLAAADPAGREQLISVGAAILNLRLALRRAGYRIEVHLLPDPADPDFAARAVAVHPAPADELTTSLAAAIPHRHTNRDEFARVPVPAAALARLRDAAAKEDATLTVSDPSVVAELARSADRRLRSQDDYRRELLRWTGPEARHDGVPGWAAGSAPMFGPHTTIMVLATDGDTPLDWLRAGQALQRVLLTATLLGLATTPISQPVEVPAVRAALLGGSAGACPQMVLRVGYGRVCGRSPRRALDEVLQPEGD